AALVAREGTPVAALATMGGHAQPQTHVQVLTNLLDFAMEPQEAIERPRFVQGRMRPTDPADRLRVEARVPARVRATLVRRRAAPAGPRRGGWGRGGRGRWPPPGAGGGGGGRAAGWPRGGRIRGATAPPSATEGEGNKGAHPPSPPPPPQAEGRPSAGGGGAE